MAKAEFYSIKIPCNDSCEQNLFLSHNVIMLSTLTIFRGMHTKKGKCKANSSIKPKGILSFFNKNLCSIDFR